MLKLRETWSRRSAWQAHTHNDIGDGPSARLAAELIGQFGVGFYSAFTVVCSSISILAGDAGDDVRRNMR
jgi:HSP90 family molecular chaperone